MAIKTKKLKSGDSVFATGVFLTLKEDNTWAVMSFEEDTFHDGASVNGISALASDNNPYIGDDEEEDIIDKLLSEDHRTIVDKVGNYLQFLGEKEQRENFLKVALDENNIPVEITRELLETFLDDIEDFEDYLDLE